MVRGYCLFCFIWIFGYTAAAQDSKKTTESVFTHIYNNCLWGKDSQGNGISGGGSLVENAKPYMLFLQTFLQDNKIKSVVDIGCGDWSFSRYLNLTGIDYSGYDIVKSVIESNNKKFATTNCRFIYADVLHIDLPLADLLICKDVLQHWSNEDIITFLKQCNKFKHCLLINDINKDNETNANIDIQTGKYHTLDLAQPPFCLHGTKLLTYKAGPTTKQIFHVGSAANSDNQAELGMTKVVYTFDKSPIDVIIPCIKKDQQTLDLCIDGIRKNGKNIRRIIVISPEKLTDNAEWYPESKYPFSKNDITEYICKNKDVSESKNRMGWIYQQLLKLYAPFIIPGISSNVLSLDADTIFLNPVNFYDEQTGAGFFNPGSEYHQPYFQHAQRLLPGFKRVYEKYSGISHHMLFQLPIMLDLFTTVECNHKKDFWKAFCDCIDTKVPSSCASEYEIYFNFTLLKTDECYIRKLRWTNFKFKYFKPSLREKFDYVSCHSYLV